MGRSKGGKKNKRKTNEMIVGSDVDESGSEEETTTTTTVKKEEEKPAPPASTSSTTAGGEPAPEDGEGEEGEGKKVKFMSKKAQQKAAQQAKQAGKKGGGKKKASEKDEESDDEDSEDEEEGQEKKEAPEEEEEEVITKHKPIKVTYCPHCTFAAEICEYGGMMDKCRPWLEANAKLLQEEIGAALTTSGEDKGRKQKKYGEKKITGEKAILFSTKKKGARGKVTTNIHGLEAYGHNLKELCQVFKKKFQCAVTVQEVSGLPDAVEIQGDWMLEVAEMLTTQPQFGKIPTKEMWVLGKANARTPFDDQ